MPTTMTCSVCGAKDKAVTDAATHTRVICEPPGWAALTISSGQGIKNRILCKGCSARVEEVLTPIEVPANLVAGGWQTC